MKAFFILFYLALWLPVNPLRAQQLNALTAQEKKEGWLLLFNGKTTAGWRNFRKQQVSPIWKVENGALHKPGATGGNLITQKQYENFILELEWKIAPGGNSGVLYGVQEDSIYFQPYFTGLEMQIVDDRRHRDARFGGTHRSGALYDLTPVSDTTAVKPAGEWNQTRIVVNNGRTQHWLNGKKVVDCLITGPEWEKRVAESKFRNWPDFGQQGRGHIVLQDHQSEVWFRNIKLKPLPGENKTAPLKRRRPVEPDSLTLTAYTGTYTLSPNPITKQLNIFQEKGKLYVRAEFMGTPYTAYLLPLAEENQFVDVLIGIRFIFQPDKAGKMAELTYWIDRNTAIAATKMK